MILLSGNTPNQNIIKKTYLFTVQLKKSAPLSVYMQTLVYYRFRDILNYSLKIIHILFITYKYKFIYICSTSFY